MTQPPSPLAHLLETVREVRLALAYVPQLCAEHKFEEALEVVEEQLVQLGELRPEAERLAGLTGQGQIDNAVRIAGACVVLVDLERSFSRGVKPRSLSGPAALPRANPDIGFADQPLW